jgi:hypothetical protein
LAFLFLFDHLSSFSAFSSFAPFFLPALVSTAVSLLGFP